MGFTAGPYPLDRHPPCQTDNLPGRSISKPVLVTVSALCQTSQYRTIPGSSLDLCHMISERAQAFRQHSTTVSGHVQVNRHRSDYGRLLHLGNHRHCIQFPLSVLSLASPFCPLGTGLAHDLPIQGRNISRLSTATKAMHLLLDIRGWRTPDSNNIPNVPEDSTPGNGGVFIPETGLDMSPWTRKAAALGEGMSLTPWTKRRTAKERVLRS